MFLNLQQELLLKLQKCCNVHLCVTKQPTHSLQTQTALRSLYTPLTFWVFKAQLSNSKTKAHFCSWRQRGSGTLCIIKSQSFFPSLSLPLFTVCTRQCLKGGSIQASTQLNFNVTDSIIGAHFILHFPCIVSTSVPPYKAREG